MTTLMEELEHIEDAAAEAHLRAMNAARRELEQANVPVMLVYRDWPATESDLTLDDHPCRTVLYRDPRGVPHTAVFDPVDGAVITFEGW